MAQRGTIFASVTNNGAYSGKLVWIGSYSVKSQDPKTNKTVLTLYGTMHNTNSAYAAYNSYDCNFQVDSKVMGSGYMGFPNEWTELGTKEVTITHNTDGSFPTTRYSIYADSYHFDGQSASGTVTAPALDRAAPTISTLTTSNVTASSFTFTATTNVNCNKWEYSLNNGATWTTFSTTNGTSASKSLTGLNPATTYTVLVRVTKTVNDITAQKSVSAATLGYATLTTVPNCNVDTATNFTYDVKATGFYYKLFFYNGSTNIKTIIIGGGKSVGSNTQSATLEGDLLSTATSATITARLVTYTSSAYSSEVGRSEKNFTLTVPNTSAYQPSVAIAISPYNTNAWIRDSATYKYWGGFTAVDITLTPTANGGATVASYGVSSPTTTKRDTYEYRTNVLSNGVVTISATVTDSRGRTATASTTVSMAYYSAPAVSSASVERGTYSGGTWTADNNGNHIRLYITGTCSLTNYGNAFTLTPTISGQATPIQSGNYYYWTDTSSNSSYTITTVLVDNTGTSSTHTLDVSSASVPFNLNTSMPAAAFGKVAETTKALELASDWRLVANGKNNIFNYLPYSWVTSGSSTMGWLRIATIHIADTRFDAPVEFLVQRRHDAKSVKLSVLFNSQNTADPTLLGFFYDDISGTSSTNPFQACIYKTGTSTWDVYVYMSGTYDSISVYTLAPNYAQRWGNITYAYNLLTSVPANAVMASQLPIINTAKQSMFSYMPYSFVTNGGSNTAGYARVATITLTNNYATAPIEFKVFRRNQRTAITLTVSFAGGSSTDPNVSSLYYEGETSRAINAFIYKSTAGTWHLYLEKTEAYDSFTVVTTVPDYMQGRSIITYEHALMSSVPSGAVVAKPIQCTSLTPTITQTSGSSSLSSSSFFRSGNVCQLSVRIVLSSAVLSGSNAFVGTVSGIPMPLNYVTAVEYTGRDAYVFSLNTSGSLTVHVTGPDSAPASSSPIGTIVYLTNS